MDGKPVVFVFGSNLLGVHGAGAALYARKHCGAVLGVGVGPTGRSYALPTKGKRGKNNQLLTLSLMQIGRHAERFMQHAGLEWRTMFQLTAIGCGLAGYTNEQICPLFQNCSTNILLPPEWLEISGLPPERHWQYGQFQWERR